MTTPELSGEAAPELSGEAPREPGEATPAAMQERYGWRDPAQHEWTAGDIAFGWAVGAGVVLAGSLVLGVLLAGSAAVVAVVIGALYGIPALTIYGVPVAIAAATALRRVGSELVHLAVFAALGAIGGFLTGLAMAGTVGVSWVVMAPAIIVGTATAVTARALAHDRALRIRGRVGSHRSHRSQDSRDRAGQVTRGSRGSTS